MHLSPQWLGFCPFLGGDFVVNDLLFYVPSVVCGGSVFGICFGMHYFLSFLVLQSP